MKKEIAKKIVSMMNNDAKRKAIQMFYDKHKDNPNIDRLMEEMRGYLNYHEEKEK